MGVWFLALLFLLIASVYEGRPGIRSPSHSSKAPVSRPISRYRGPWVAAYIFGTLVVVVSIGLLVYFCCLHRRGKQSPSAVDEVQDVPSTPPPPPPNFANSPPPYPALPPPSIQPPPYPALTAPAPTAPYPAPTNVALGSSLTDALQPPPPPPPPYSTP
ncbi:expressed protein [Echinococcus multilocularis]|uniref:Expressed protein n=1 Tax=Echinococcus multilocularis TaxID=6211 RepID=A0A068Y4M7_ECHMU|nr:expressed protein [Echinococcus multilocularis]